MGKHEINYLKPKSILEFASIHLVSFEGETFLMDKTVLAAASKLFCDLLLDQEDCNERVVFNTQIPKSHLGLFCQFVSTGTMPSNCYDVSLVSSFNNLGVNLESGLKLETVPAASLPDFDLNYSFQCSVEVTIKKEETENGIDDGNNSSTRQSTRPRKVKVEWDENLDDGNDFIPDLFEQDYKEDTAWDKDKQEGAEAEEEQPLAKKRKFKKHSAKEPK